MLWGDWPIFMILASNEQLQQQLEYTLLKPDCQRWWISKMQSGREDTLEERYAIKFCFKLGKMAQKRMKCFRLLLEHLAWIELQFFSAGGDFFEGDYSFMCVLSIKVPIRKRSGNLSYAPRNNYYC